VVFADQSAQEGIGMKGNRERRAVIHQLEERERKYQSQLRFIESLEELVKTLQASRKARSQLQ